MNDFLKEFLEQLTPQGSISTSAGIVTGGEMGSEA